MAQAISGAAPAPRKPLYKVLYVQVLFAVACGILLGHFYPQLGEQMKPLGDAFIKLVKMIIAPVSSPWAPASGCMVKAARPQISRNSRSIV